MRLQLRGPENGNESVALLKRVGRAILVKHLPSLAPKVIPGSENSFGTKRAGVDRSLPDAKAVEPFQPRENRSGHPAKAERQPAGSKAHRKFENALERGSRRAMMSVEERMRPVVRNWLAGGVGLLLVLVVGAWVWASVRLKPMLRERLITAIRGQYQREIEVKDIGITLFPRFAAIIEGLVIHQKDRPVSRR